MTIRIGHGLPWWLPLDFLDVEQTLALGEVELSLSPRAGACPACELGIPKRGYATVLDPAHIVDKQMGGRPKGSGPTVRICRSHHDMLHFAGDGICRTMAIRETDGAVCWLECEPAAPWNNIEATATPAVKAYVLGFRHPWEW